MAMGQVIGKEARGLNNQGIKTGGGHYAAQYNNNGDVPALKAGPSGLYVRPCPLCIDLGAPAKNVVKRTLAEISVGH